MSNYLQKRIRWIFTVPNPVFGIEKANGAVVVVALSGDVFAEGSLNENPVVGGGVASAFTVGAAGLGKPKVFVGITSAVLAVVAVVVVVVVDFWKLNAGNDELVIGGRIVEISFPLVDDWIFPFSTSRSKSCRASAS